MAIARRSGREVLIDRSALGGGILRPTYRINVHVISASGLAARRSDVFIEFRLEGTQTVVRTSTTRNDDVAAWEEAVVIDGYFVGSDLLNVAIHEAKHKKVIGVAEILLRDIQLGRPVHKTITLFRVGAKDRTKAGAISVQLHVQHPKWPMHRAAVEFKSVKKLVTSASAVFIWVELAPSLNRQTTTTKARPVGSLSWKDVKTFVIGDYETEELLVNLCNKGTGVVIAGCTIPLRDFEVNADPVTKKYQLDSGEGILTVKIKVDCGSDPIDMKRRTVSLRDIRRPRDRSVSFRFSRAPRESKPLLTVNLAMFENMEQIGQGAFGDVFSAVESWSHRKVAIKIPRKKQLNNRDAMLFQREVEILGSVKHETVLELVGYVPLDAPNGDPPAIVTDYMNRGSLQELIDMERTKGSQTGWDTVQKLIVVYGISVGMLILHRNQIIHRDLKPGNILLNDKLEPKVADFGLSKREGADEQSVFEATLFYMAPEMHNAMDYDHSVDIYAYGILLYSVLSGRIPFDHVDGSTRPFAVANMVCDGTRPMIPAGFDGRWRRLMVECWNSAPALRPTFEYICRRLGSVEFTQRLNESELSKFMEYRTRVSPPDLEFPDPLIVELSSYTRLEQIGEGTLGRIDLARDNLSGETVAIRSIRRYVLNEDIDPLFRRKVGFLASFDDATLLSLRGYVPLDAVNGDEPAIITDYIRGMSLERLFEEARTEEGVTGWDSVQKLIVVYGIAVGMLILHRNQVVHRNLKPGNVLLDESLEPKVADFGLAEFINARRALAHTGNRGAPFYMAPELHAGGKYDMSADVYAYGIVVYCTIVGQNPYEGEKFQNDESLGQKVLKGHRPVIPRDLEEKWRCLLQQCWEQTPSDRPKFEAICRMVGSAEFRADLDEAGAARFCEYRMRVSPPDLIGSDSLPDLTRRPLPGAQ
jgi:serine/threonine protein kinase